jgi:DNA repair protein RadC
VAVRERAEGDEIPWDDPPSAAGRAEPGRILPFAPKLTCGRPRAFDPRVKIVARGASALTTAELLSLLLGRRGRGEPSSGIAARLLKRHGLGGLAALPAARWGTERGVGSATAARLSAVFEIARRAYGRDGERERTKISRPADAFALVRDLGSARKEHLVGLYLDAQNGLLERETLSIGSLNTTRTHPREILYPAIRHLALGFILAHNHPSGCLEPSDEDVEFTRSVRRAGELMGIELYDHLIVAAARYTSLRERGLL